MIISSNISLQDFAKKLKYFTCKKNDKMHSYVKKNKIEKHKILSRAEKHRVPSDIDITTFVRKMNFKVVARPDYYENVLDQ